MADSSSLESSLESSVSLKFIIVKKKYNIQLIIYLSISLLSFSTSTTSALSLNLMPGLTWTGFGTDGAGGFLLPEVGGGGTCFSFRSLSILSLISNSDDISRIIPGCEGPTAGRRTPFWVGGWWYWLEDGLVLLLLLLLDVWMATDWRNVEGWWSKRRLDPNHSIMKLTFVPFCFSLLTVE